MRVENVTPSGGAREPDVVSIRDSAGSVLETSDTAVLTCVEKEVVVHRELEDAARLGAPDVTTP